VPEIVLVDLKRLGERLDEPWAQLVGDALT
jgi:hypothetical protein